jgi:hypothetical protein
MAHKHEYNHKVVRYEKYRDKDGNVVSIFLAVQVWDNAGNSLYHEYWLKSGGIGLDGKEQEDEVAAVVADENNLIPILERVIAEAIKRLEDEIANKPKPPIIASAAECDALCKKLSHDWIAKHLMELKEAEERQQEQPMRPAPMEDIVKNSNEEARLEWLNHKPKRYGK